MAFNPNDEKVIEYYIKEEVKKHVSDEKIKNLIHECLKEMIPNSKIDAKKIYVCSYIDENNDMRIGLFNREDVFHPIKTVGYSYSYSVYKGIDSNYVGIFCISNDPIHNERWLEYGDSLDDGKYVVNCKMNNCLGNFDKFRQKWRKEKNISTPYDASLTDMNELTDIRDYIEEYNKSNNSIMKI